MTTVATASGATSKRYQRITRTRGSLLTKHSLWVGEGELLWMDFSAMQEHYRRFFLEDVQALVVYPSRRRARLRWVVSVLGGLLPSLLLWWMTSTVVWPVAWWIIPVSLLVWNEWAGPSVTVTLVTAVQRLELRPLKRRREFDALRAALLAAGALTPTPPPAAEVSTPPTSPGEVGEAPAPAP